MIGITGLYPIIALAEIELYHLIKLVLLGLILWLSRYAKQLNFAGVTGVAIIFMAFSGYSSLSDQPKFSKKMMTFEETHSEISYLSEVEKGRVIFTTICAQCHGEDGKKRRFQAADLTLSKLTLEQRIETVLSGIPFTVMRSFQNELSKEEIQEVAKYIGTFKIDKKKR